MKKVFIAATGLLVLAACQKNKETVVKSEDTIIETQHDTVKIDTDTIAAAEEKTEAKEEIAAPAVNKTATAKPIAATTADYASFGDKIMADKALTKDEMLKKYKGMKPGDTVTVKFKSKINDVCQKKGCWMSLELPNGKESFVKFKDYAFFVPLNAANQEAIVNGKAFVSEISVAQLRHYAKDGGKPEEEIAKITEPKVTYGFMADGVLISK